MKTEISKIAPPARRLPIGPLFFCFSLLLIGVSYVGIAAWRYFQPEPKPRNIAAEAEALLREMKPEPLSQTLEQLLEDARNYSAPSKDHPLLGKKAPDFSGTDVFGVDWSLSESLKNGPVVVIFYLGYHCNHCVSQLFDVNEDYSYFRELGAEVVALSPDSASTTAERYKEFRPFGFHVLQDPGNKIAQAYGVFTPAAGGTREQLLHGTFIVDQAGVVRWATFGEQPFSDNRTLLGEIAKIGRLPKKRP